MTRRYALLAGLLLLLGLYSISSSARTLKACGHPFYPPVSWHSAGQLIGLAPAITRQLFAELGYRVQLIGGNNWKRCLLEVQQGKADIVVAAYRIASRESYLSFSEQHIIADSVTLFVNRKQPIRFNQLEDLRGKTVGLLLGDSFGDSFDRFIQQNSHIEYVSRGRQNFAKLALGRIDYMPLGKLSGRLQSRKLGFHDQVKPLEREITTEYYYLAVGRHSGLQQHLPFINHRLREMHRSGEIGRLTARFSLDYLNSP
ncbi:substrate-binding periplasmic protein [Marinobacterium arenosum]|uniref:substrate-binding periplasmic protein n=1 Tax=Marinobacterium arenosum TaxID=2862496 RepID=UPI001C982C96|nr:transporter substrate-binding domain-containing protein [Marinobacterium arenosum]MBY4678763.1 transporter substrate-binding domain-containing protein [Marinobacterium arenosum]